MDQLVAIKPIMKYTALFALLLIPVMLLRISPEKATPKLQLRPVQDTINPLLIPVDSIEAYGNWRYKPFKKQAHASYYSNKFNGRRTASGKKFSNNKYMAAHRKFPFGTKLRVTNEHNGQCVIVEVADRGPFTKGREIDLSRRAFMDIAHDKRLGGLKVTIAIIQ